MKDRNKYLREGFDAYLNGYLGKNPYFADITRTARKSEQMPHQHWKIGFEMATVLSAYARHLLHLRQDATPENAESFLETCRASRYFCYTVDLLLEDYNGRYGSRPRSQHPCASAGCSKQALCVCSSG
jgi:hypothetical protein